MTHVRNMKSPRSGEPVKNQFIITLDDASEVFQSYDTVIAHKGYKIYLDHGALDYSATTSKYLYQFLDMKRKEIEAKIESGEIETQDLN